MNKFILADLVKVKPKFLPRIIDSVLDDDLRYSSQVHILREELHLGILPIGGRGRNHGDFAIELVGSENDKAERVLLSIEGIYRSSTCEFICDIVNNMAQNLTYFGSIRYEIVEQKKGFTLHYIPQSSFYDLGILGVQIVPKKQREHMNKQFIFRSKKYIWDLSFPDAICSKTRYINILDKLSKYTELMPRKIPHDKIFEADLGFDGAGFNKQTKKYIYKTLNDIGGAQRETNLTHVNEYYLINRMIRMNLSKVLLREHIINKINFLFSKLNIDSKIVIKGLPASDEIRNALSDLEAGTLGLNEALKQTNVY